MASSRRPVFRIVTAASCCYQLCLVRFRFSKNFLPTAPMKDRSFTPRWRPFYRASKRKSSNVRTKLKASSLCQNVGLSNAPSVGSTDAADWPRTGNVSTVERSLSSNLPPFASCCESYAILVKVSGRTLRDTIDAGIAASHRGCQGRAACRHIAVVVLYEEGHRLSERRDG